MCGIAGVLSGAAGQINEDSLRRMADRLYHRGPDSGGHVVDHEAGIALVHRRLAVLDTSEAGHQPMQSVSGRYQIVFNGEIYNHLELRAELRSSRSIASASLKEVGFSDTETLLMCIETWGINTTLKRANGMFALAVWDKKTAVLNLARDRAGEKPLYFGWIGSQPQRRFVFASDLAAITCLPDHAFTVDRDALALFIRHNYIPAPRSIFQDIEKLPPGVIKTISLSSLEELSNFTYWTVPKVAEPTKDKTDEFEASRLVNALEHRISDAVRQQMIADVPIGAFLSGGIDSSTIVALMQEHHKKPVKTFTIGFDVPQYNEAAQAKAIANHIGTDHTELYVTPKMALDVVPEIPKMFSEPFADSSQIPTYLVAKLARQDVTVALSGDAGDELFGGYERYRLGLKAWSLIRMLPDRLRASLSGALLKVPPEVLERIIPSALLFSGLSNPSEKISKAAKLLASGSFEDMYWRLISHHSDTEGIKLGLSPENTFRTAVTASKSHDKLSSMMTWDFISYLPDDILVKVDRSAMWVSLETRVPFLDPEIIKFARQLPNDVKIRAGQSKWILRRVLDKRVPSKLTNKPKMGFGIPLADWLRGPLKEWATLLLDEKIVEEQGFFNPANVTSLWQDHTAGRRDNAHLLWNILQFQQWYLEQKKLGVNLQ